MSEEEKRKVTYERIKKRLGDHRYLSAFLAIGEMVSAALFVFSLFPLVPVIVLSLLGPSANSSWIVPLWFICIGVFSVLFWLFQRFYKKVEQKRGITLEERIYVLAYESLRSLNEYLDPEHPISGSGSKAVRRLRDVDSVFGSTGFPYMSLIGEAASQMGQLRGNLETRLIPAISRSLDRTDTRSAEDARSILVALLDYLSKPQLPELVALNKRMSSLPQVTEKNVSRYFKDALLKRSNLRHAVVFSIFAVFASMAYYVDINYLDAPTYTGFEFGLMFFAGLVGIYVTYLGVTGRRDQRT